MRENFTQHEEDGRIFQDFRVPFDDESAVIHLTAILDEVFSRAQEREVVLVCVGTDRSTGDAFGPIVGSKLANTFGVQVYGSLDDPVHAVNLATTLEEIQQQFVHRPFILAIDACLGKFDHVGHIIVEEGPLRPGAGVKKTLPEFGDFTLTGVVNVCGFMEYFVLQNTRLGIVMRMTDIVVQALRNSLHRHQMRKGIVEAVHRI